MKTTVKMSIIAGMLIQLGSAYADSVANTEVRGEQQRAALETSEIANVASKVGETTGRQARSGDFTTLSKEELEAVIRAAVSESNKELDNNNDEEKSDEDKKKDERRENDKDYERLSCKGETESHDKAMCLSENLDEIKEMIEDSEGRKKARYQNLYQTAKRSIKSALAKTYDPESTDPAEAKEKFNELKDSAALHGDDTLNRQLDRLGKGLEQESKIQRETLQINQQFQDQYVPALTEYTEMLRVAKLTGNLQMEFMAQTNLDMIKSEIGMQNSRLKQLDPELRMTTLGNLTQVSGLDYWQSNFDTMYLDIQNSIRQIINQGTVLSSSNSGNVNNGNSINGQGRQARNPGFNTINQMPNYGSPFDNLMIDTKMGMDEMNLGNMGFNAADFMNNNGASLRPRG